MKKALIYFTFLLFVFGSTILIYSCSKKELANPSSTVVPANLLEAAKNWHAQQTNSATTLSINAKNYTLQPVWKEAKLKTLSNGRSLIIVSSPDFKFDLQSTSGGSRKFVFTSENGEITDGEIIETVGKIDYMSIHGGNLIDDLSAGNATDFSGYEVMYDLNYKWLSSTVYKNGVKQPATAMIRGDAGQHKDGKGSNVVTLSQCYAYYEVETDLFTGNETWTYLFTACDSGTGYGDGGGGGGGSGTGPGPSQPGVTFGLNNSNAQISDTNFDAFLDYAASQGMAVSDPFYTSVTVNGVVYWGEVTQLRNSSGVVVAGYFSPDATGGPFTMGYEYNIGDGKGDPEPANYIIDFGVNYFGNYPIYYTPGGGSGPTAPTIITSALTHDYPCATALIVNKLALNSQYTNWSGPFNTTRKPDLTWTDGSLPWNVAVSGSTAKTYVLGQTGYAGRSATITLNSSMLTNSTQLLIAAAAIHETLHAYINYNIETAVGGFLPPANFANNGTWFYSMEVWATMHGLPTNYSSHYTMLSSYFATAVSILASWDNNAHTTKQYAMAMLYGLDNATDGTAAQKTILQTEYSNLLTQYGITASDLTTFYNANLISTTGKLPTSGC